MRQIYRRKIIAKRLGKTWQRAGLAWLATGIALFFPVAQTMAQQGGQSVDNVWTRASLLGDLNGLRPYLDKHGMSLAITETSEYLRNTSGGLATGGNYQGVTTITWGLDTMAAGMWQNGGTLNVSVMNIHGRQFSAEYLGSLQTASGIEADDTTRLWELWYEQSFNGGGLDLRIGQQSIDQEFMVSQYSGLFVETMNGWPALPSYDMQSGGPAYPLSGVGARMRVALKDNLTLLAGAYAGDPNPQMKNDHGTTFSLEGGVLYIAELQYGVNQTASDTVGKPSGLPATYKVGAWAANTDFADERFDDVGLSLASPASSGNPMQRSGNFSFYAVADKTVWKERSGGARSLNLFARPMLAPGDRNLIGFSIDAGVTVTAPIAGRENDVAGIAIAYARVGDHVTELDDDIAQFNTNPGYPRRKDELVLELTYALQVAPWWQILGDIQFTGDPGAGAEISGDPTGTQAIGDTWVFGVRTNIAF